MERTYKALDMTNPATIRAAARCRKLHPKVRCLDFDRGLFVVSASRPGQFYRVQLHVTPNGKFLPDCHCRAGVAGQICYHAAAAAQVWLMLADLRERAQAQAVAADSTDAAEEIGGANIETFCAECGRYLDPGEWCEAHPRAEIVTERELRRLERERSVLVKPQPVGVRCDGWQV